MKLKNKIFNYFVIPPHSPTGMPRVVLSPVTMPAHVAKPLIERQFKKEEKPGIPRRPILHVCYDYDSQRVYVPNSQEFSKEEAHDLLLAAEIRITKDFGGFSSAPPIKGSPFTSLRVRSLNSFPHARKVISDHYKGKVFKDLPVVEAALNRMPSTTKSLPPMFSQSESFLGGYVGPEFASSVNFVEEIDLYGKKHKEPISLLSQATPFILINVAETTKRQAPTATEKEWVVLSGYRDYLHDEKTASEEKYISGDINKFADLYAIKRYLYLGWSFEEVSSIMLGNASNLVSLFKGIDRVMKAVESLKAEGYKNVAGIPYYMTFKVDESFPIKLDSLIDPNTGKVATAHQYQSLLVLDYDKRNDHVLIETPAFVSPEICIRVLKAKSTPFIARYNPSVNTIDIKSTGRSFSDLRGDNKVQLAKINGIIRSELPPENAKDLDYRGGELASGISSVNPKVYNVRKISDYLYATDHIQAMCDRLKIPFKDFDVVIGPIEQVLGQGTQGGFMDENAFTKSKIKTPFEISKGVFMSPPVILINSLSMPSYAEQTETLIHEYRHYLYGLQHPNYQIGYGRPKKNKNGQDYEHWYNYFTDPNEREAHREEIKFELGLGKSYDEIIRNKVGGQITMDNYPIALKFSEMVKEALQELEDEKEHNEEPPTDMNESLGNMVQQPK